MTATAKRLTANRLTTGMARTTAPSSGSDGCDITSWAALYGDRVPRDYLLYLSSSAAATITGAALWLYFADRAAWTNVGLLNGATGTVTIVGAAQDYSEVVSYVGLASRMAVVGTWSAGTPAASCEPIEGG